MLVCEFKNFLFRKNSLKQMSKKYTQLVNYLNSKIGLKKITKQYILLYYSTQNLS